jgi:hypothetical protein
MAYFKYLPPSLTRATPPAGLALDEVELSVEINGQGQVSILGSSGTLSNRGAINLKFKRVASPSSIDQE